MPLTPKRRRRSHPPTCRHCPRVRLLGHDYRVWREAHDLAEEGTTGAYPAEVADYRATHAAPTFRRYLEAMAGAGWPMSGTAPRRYLTAA